MSIKEIWNLQNELNKMIGVDTIQLGELLKTQEMGHIIHANEWYVRFLDEARHEWFEAKCNFFHKWWVKEVKEDPKKHYTIIDKAKLKLELIDVLHFLVSACHCRGITVDEIEKKLNYHRNSFYSAITSEKDLYWFICDLQSKTAVEQLVMMIEGCFMFLGVGMEEIETIYRMKHQKNVERQKNNYSVATKTEADNEEIEDKIRKSC